MVAVASAPAGPSLTRAVRVERIMGMPISVHVLGNSSALRSSSEDAIDRCFAELRDIDRVFSPFRADSDICRLARGELHMGDADPRVREVEALCLAAEIETDGLFTATWRDRFDPTGYVKGWAVERAARRHLAPLLPSEAAVGINAGGDMQLFTADGADWQWSIGIADPHRAGALIATFEIRSGAIATSGTAERGKHIIDPRTGEPALGVSSATVVAESLALADLWATTAVVAGFDDRYWVARSGSRTGIMIADDGRSTRWLDGVSIDVDIARPVVL